MRVATKAVPPVAVPGSPDGLCLLVVEDDEADTYLVFRALMAHPAVGRIVHASNGAMALRMIEDGEVAPDLAFIDLKMPVMDGFGLLTSLSDREGPGFPMVVLTSSDSPVDAKRSRLRSALRVVVKPGSLNLLELVLKRAIEAAVPSAASAAPAPQTTRKPLLDLQFSRVNEFGYDELS